MSAFTNEVVGPLTDIELRATPVPVSGTVTATPSGTQDVNVVSSVEVEVKNDTGNPVPVNGTVTANAGTGDFTVVQPTGSNLHVQVDGTVAVTQGGSATATTTQITSTGSNQTVLASNANRKRAIFFFNSGIWDIKLGATASSTSRLLRVSSNNYILEIDYYTGQIDAACTTSGKLLDVTEIA